MINSVFKRKRRRNGVVVESTTWYGRYSLHPDDKPETVNLHVTDKAIAQKKLTDIIVQKQREAAGLLPPAKITETRKAPLHDLIDEFLDYKRGLRQSPKWIDIMEYRLYRLARECVWEKVADIDLRGFERWRARTPVSGKTLNEYGTALKRFFEWMIERGLALSNPFRDLTRVKHTTTFERRCLTREELQRLVAVSGEFMPFYLIAATTGLRKGEIESLRWCDIILDDNPRIIRSSATTKNAHRAELPIRRDLAEVIAAHRPDPYDPEAQAFRKCYRTYWIRQHLSAAGIAYVTAEGRADFHCLRHTFCTLIAETGADFHVVKKLMRHSDFRMTEHYTHHRDGRDRAAIEALPALIPGAAAGGGTQIGTQKSVPDCPELSGTVRNCPEPSRPKPAETKGKTEKSAETGEKSGASEMAPAVGLEPRRTPDKHWSKMGGGTQIWTHNFEDEDLRVVVEAWEGLPDEVKRRVVDLVRRGVHV